MDKARRACARAALAPIGKKYKAVTVADVIAQDMGHAFHHGMHLGWAWGQDDTGAVYLDFLSEHRMTDMAALRFFADGSFERIETPWTFRRIADDPEEDKELKRQYAERNARIYADLRARGLLPPLGENLGSQDMNEILRSGYSTDG
jgi:hypothetical protein